MWHWLQNLFVVKIKQPCEACIARDYHIQSLLEQIKDRNKLLADEIRTNHDDMNDIIKHITGMNRIAAQQHENKEFKSIPRQGGIGNRIKNIENKVNSESELISAQRRKEYEERVEALSNPKLETLVLD